MILDLLFWVRFTLWFITFASSGIVGFVCILIAMQQSRDDFLRKKYALEDQTAALVFMEKRQREGRD